MTSLVVHRKGDIKHDAVLVYHTTTIRYLDSRLSYSIYVHIPAEALIWLVYIPLL
jgi:hypothetical protein